MARNRYRKRSESSSVAGWVIAGVLGILLVLGGGFVIVFLVFNPFGGKPFIDKGNPNVSADGFARIEDGMTRAELEHFFGPSYVPDENDFAQVVHDDPFGGRKQDSFEVQRMAAQRQLILAWSRGNVRIMVAFHKPPNEGGLSLTRVLRDEDGSITYIQGDMQAMVQRDMMKRLQQRPPVIPWPNQPQLPAGAANTTAAALHREFVEDSNGATQKYASRELTLTGVIKIKLGGAIWVQGSTANGTVSAMFDAVEQVKLGKYQVGSSITFSGQIITYFQVNETLGFGQCKILE
jgi:hypothetical protein